MKKTPGVVVPASYPVTDEFKAELARRNALAGFSDFDPSEFDAEAATHSDVSLAHFGIKGMKWGVRRSDIPGVSRATSRDAAKDAREFARAKMFYGESAGTRRKLIKATVEGKSKKDPAYKKAFDAHLERQDMSRHASKARSERKVKNVKNSTAKTARGISHLLRGNAQYASAAAATLFGGAMYAHKKGIDKIVLNAGKKAYRNIKNGRPKEGQSAYDFLKSMGID